MPLSQFIVEMIENKFKATLKLCKALVRQKCQKKELPIVEQFLHLSYIYASKTLGLLKICEL